MAKAARIPAGLDRVIPHLVIKGVGEALKFYEKAFGAKETVRMAGPDGKSIAHAEFKIGASVFFVAEECPGVHESPITRGGTSVTLSLYVEDVDKAFKQALNAGAKEIMPPTDMFWGDRYCKFVDPFGHAWALATHLEDLSPQEMARRGQEAMKQMQMQQ
jgi:PhnB protein